MDVIETLPPDIAEAVQILIDRSPRDQVAGAIQKLRERSHLTQEQLGQYFKRSRPAIAMWETGRRLPPPGMTGELLRVFGISTDGLVTGNLDSFLDSAAYQCNDPDIVENRWFIATRGQVLEKIKLRALNGSPADSKLYLDWMERNERKIAARVTGAIPVRDDVQSLRNRAVNTTSGRRRITEAMETTEKTEPQVVDNTEPTS